MAACDGRVLARMISQRRSVMSLFHMVPSCLPHRNNEVLRAISVHPRPHALLQNRGAFTSPTYIALLSKRFRIITVPPPRVARLWPKASFGRTRATFGRSQGNVIYIWPNSGHDFGQHRPGFGRNEPSSARFGRTRAKFDRCRANLGRNLAEIARSRAEFRRHRPTLADSGAIWIELVPILGPNPIDAGPTFGLFFARARPR